MTETEQVHCSGTSWILNSVVQSESHFRRSAQLNMSLVAAFLGKTCFEKASSCKRTKLKPALFFIFFYFFFNHLPFKKNFLTSFKKSSKDSIFVFEEVWPTQPIYEKVWITHQSESSVCDYANVDHREQGRREEKHCGLLDAALVLGENTEHRLTCGNFRVRNSVAGFCLRCAKFACQRWMQAFQRRKRD